MTALKETVSEVFNKKLKKFDVISTIEVLFDKVACKVLSDFPILFANGTMESEPFASDLTRRMDHRG